ncbi:hypothetical protein AB5I41_25405 [Sphingomonas sp. MMS24-JH45]
MAARLWAATAATWVRQAPVTRSFAAAGAVETLGDFGMTMTTLERDAGWLLRLGAAGDPRVGDDEARLLALFDAAIAGRPVYVRRHAAALVEEDAVSRLALAVESVATRITDGVFVERDR